MLISIGAVGIWVWRAHFSPEYPPILIDRFRCLKCGYEFAVDVGCSIPDLEMITDCPKCAAKGESRLMVMCFECERFYLPGFHIDPNLQGQPGAYTCEHCGTDALTMEQWYMEDAEKRKSSTPPATQRGDVLQK